MKTLSVRGTELRCVDRGTGLPLLLVHGFPLDHTMWAAEIDELSSRYRVIAPDLRGFGKSPAQGEKVTMAEFADDLAALVDALKIDEPIVFCGLSMGGYIAFQFCRKYADRLRALILCDTRAAADAPDAADARWTMANRVLDEGPATLVESMLPRVLGETTQRQQPEVVEQVRRVMMNSDARGIAAALRGMAERPDMTASLAEIRCPTLALVGSEDILTPSAEMRAMAHAIPAARFVEIPAAGHLAPWENPAAVNVAMAEFLATL